MAMEWFVSLPEGHIMSFTQLSQLFREQYLANRAPPAVSYDLFDVKQYQGETLKEYISRFGAHVVKVGTKEEPMIVYAFRKGVCPRPFCESIIRNRPKTFAEIRRHAVEQLPLKGVGKKVHKKHGKGKRPSKMNESSTKMQKKNDKCLLCGNLDISRRTALNIKLG
ncbi:uncharacterized protein [Phaseolus vulgaris]|uniref:uncharacterized protein n=1 Tax=Phaseolus vulgaris TaxID=3885 RepID=UPI0035CC1355